jgi:hypothetical protein
MIEQITSPALFVRSEGVVSTVVTADGKTYINELAVWSQYNTDPTTVQARELFDENDQRYLLTLEEDGTVKKDGVSVTTPEPIADLWAGGKLPIALGVSGQTYDLETWEEAAGPPHLLMFANNTFVLAALDQRGALFLGGRNWELTPNQPEPMQMITIYRSNYIMTLGVSGRTYNYRREQGGWQVLATPEKMVLLSPTNTGEFYVLGLGQSNQVYYYGQWPGTLTDRSYWSVVPSAPAALQASR